MGKPREQYKLPNESSVNVTRGWPSYDLQRYGHFSHWAQPNSAVDRSTRQDEYSDSIISPAVVSNKPGGHSRKRQQSQVVIWAGWWTPDITIVVTVYARYRRYCQAMKWGWKLHNRVTGHRKVWYRLLLIRHGRSWCWHQLVESTAGTDVTCKQMRQASPPSRPLMSSQVSNRMSQRWARLSCRRVCLRYLVDRTGVQSSLIVWSKCVRVNTSL